MKRIVVGLLCMWVAAGVADARLPAQQSAAPPTPIAAADLAVLKSEAAKDVDGMRVFTQQMVDQVFSYGELGFQEFETSKYLTGILEQNGFSIERNYAGIPTAWVARWGAGHPIIAIGSDLDCIPQASQKPGVAYHDPLIDGAPGHGEGHNSGVPLNITAVLAVKKLMAQRKIPGTLIVWPGVAEEVDGAKAFFVKAGLFKDVDAVLFSHVDNNYDIYWGDTNRSALVSIQYDFVGESAHAAGQPWRGRSALDAVELMDVGWNFRREHLRLQHRSHYVIPNGGDQPNVVPSSASVWYYLRETDYAHLKQLWAINDKIAYAAASMTDTTVSSRLLGSAWAPHTNKALTEALYENVKAVGMPDWSEDDQALARGLQRELKVPEIGLATKILPLHGVDVIPDDDKRGGGSDDIGDVSWNVPTVILNYPANIPLLPGHNWANGVAMATPIAHKGVTAGAKVAAMTILDVLTRPEVITQAWEYFRNVQTKDIKYVPFIEDGDRPATWLNAATMEKYRSRMKSYYYDAAKYPSYLAQLGIKYPTVRAIAAR